MVIGDVDMLLRVGAAAGLGAAVGFERQRGGHPAGLRTHLLVALASATLMLVSAHFAYFQAYTRDDPVAVDPSRIAAAVVAGAGFLGAGVLVRSGPGVRGVTAAATLWLAAAVGLAAGAGMFLLAAAATVVTLLTLIAFRRLTKARPPAVPARRVTVTLKDAGAARAAVLTRLAAGGAGVADAGYDLDVRRGRSRLDLDVRAAAPADLDRVVDLLAAMPEVRRVRVRPTAG